jgi:hypothetical protein
VRPWAVTVRRFASCFVVAALVGGCFTDGGGEAGAGTEAAATTGTTAAVDPTTGGASPTTGGTTTTGSTTTDATTGAPTCDPPGELALSAKCSDGCACASGKCFTIEFFGGWCSECTSDADCPGGGCTLPDPNTPVGAMCNNGGPGANCMSDAVCNDPGYPFCALLYELPDILSVRACSQCASASDCPESAPFCAPDYTLGIYGGIRTCVTAGGRADGKGCDLDGACASGHCGVAAIQGLIVLPVCGACSTDTDCLEGQTCVAGVIDPQAGTIDGSTCQ